MKIKIWSYYDSYLSFWLSNYTHSSKHLSFPHWELLHYKHLFTDYAAKILEIIIWLFTLECKLTC